MVDCSFARRVPGRDEWPERSGGDRSVQTEVVVLFVSPLSALLKTHVAFTDLPGRALSTYCEAGFTMRLLGGTHSFLCVC